MKLSLALSIVALVVFSLAPMACLNAEGSAQEKPSEPAKPDAPSETPAKPKADAPGEQPKPDAKPIPVPQQPENPRLTVPTKVRYEVPETIEIDGESLEVWVAMKAPEGKLPAGLQFDVEFPTAVLKLEGKPELSDFGNAQKQAISTSIKEGLVRVIVFGLNQNTIPSGARIKLKFSVTKPEKPEAWSGTIKLLNGGAASPDAKEIDTEAFDGTLKFAAEGK